MEEVEQVLVVLVGVVVGGEGEERRRKRRKNEGRLAKRNEHEGKSVFRYDETKRNETKTKTTTHTIPPSFWDQFPVLLRVAYDPWKA